MIRKTLRLLLGAFAALVSAFSDQAYAHPHVWVTANSEIVYSSEGAVISVRHHWSFDEMFSTFATQGLDSNNDGKLSREELQGLAEVNVTSIKEFDYYTHARNNGIKLPFKEAVDYWLEYDNGVLTLHFTLPLQVPARPKVFEISISDWSYFVDFSLAKENAVRLIGAPAGCRFALGSDSSFKPPGPVGPFGAPPLSNRISVNCP